MAHLSGIRKVAVEIQVIHNRARIWTVRRIDYKTENNGLTLARVKSHEVQFIKI